MSRARLFSQLDVLEDDALTLESAPRARALRRWRGEVSESAGFALLAPDAILGRGEEADAALERLGDAATALAAEAIVVRPRPAFTPSQGNRDHLTAVLGETLAAAAAGAVAVVVPTGLWEPGALIPIADAAGALIAIDPLANDPTGEMATLVEDQLGRGQAYLRLDRFGSSRRRYDAFELEQIAEIAAAMARCWVIFGHGDKVRDGVALRRLLES
jgi:hypothetical protein